MPKPPDPPPGVPGHDIVYRACAWLAFTIMRVQRWRFHLRGFDHVPRKGGAVIATNHTSFWDYFTVGREGYYRYGRPVRILAKETLFDMPVFGALMKRARHIPVHRGSGQKALASAITALKDGELVLVLPEQTVSPSFELLPFKTGAARMAAAAGVPLIPVVSWGSHRFNTVGHWPRWRWRLPVMVYYGEPLHPAPDDDPREVTEQLRQRIETLLHQAQADYPETAEPGADWWVPARLGGGAPTPEEADEFVQRLRRQWPGQRRKR